MSLPHQIYCDYLEDKGIDTRLLRTQEPDGITVTNAEHHPAWKNKLSGNGVGYGYYTGNIYGDGELSDYNTDYGYGFIGDMNGNGGSAGNYAGN